MAATIHPFVSLEGMTTGLRLYGSAFGVHQRVQVVEIILSFRQVVIGLNRLWAVNLFGMTNTKPTLLLAESDAEGKILVKE